MNDHASLRDCLHTMRNQLNLITGHASLVRESANLTDKERDDLHVIVRAAFTINDQLMIIESLFSPPRPASA